jgi:hypothetical protein
MDEGDMEISCVNKMEMIAPVPLAGLYMRRFAREKTEELSKKV